MIVDRTVHIVSTDFEYAGSETPDSDRVGYIFNETSVGKVYILQNTNIVSASEEIEKESLEGVKKVIEEKTEAAKKGGIEVVETDFYNIKDAIVDVYSILHEEIEEGSNIYVNISGGTKPLAIAMSFACALADESQSAFYIPKKYEKVEDQGQVQIVPNGVAENTEVANLDLLKIDGLIPSEKHERNFLRFMNNIDEDMVGVTKLLDKNDAFDDVQDQDENTFKQKYYDRGRKLAESGYVNKEGKGYSLTEKGELIARLVSIQYSTKK